MQKNYSLTILGLIVDKIENSFLSTQRIATSLANNFRKYKNIELKLVNIDIKFINDNNLAKEFLKHKILETDFLLIHTDLPKIIENINVIKNRIKYKICNFMEDKQNLDMSFGYIRKIKPSFYISYPCDKNILIKKIKKKNSVLLDNKYGEYDISEDLIKWSKKLISKGFEFYQLTKDYKKKYDYIKPIYMSNYSTYLESTSEIENFVLTHPGSYEHSIVDMYARGINVLIPNNQNNFMWPDRSTFFAKKEIVDDLNLYTFSNEEDYINILTNKKENVFNYHLITDMEDVVKFMNEIFIKIKEKHDNLF